MTSAFNIAQLPRGFVRWLLTCGAFWLVTACLQWFAFDLAWYKVAIQQGDYWRLWTGHLVHLNWTHWVMNVAALSLVFAFAPCMLHPLRWLSCLVLSGAVIGILLLDSQFEAYLGLSGVSYGMMMYGLLVDKGLTPLLRGLALLLTVSKVLLEQWFPEMNNDTAQMIGGRVAIDAHLYGAITGSLLACVELLWRRPRLRRLLRL